MIEIIRLLKEIRDELIKLNNKLNNDNRGIRPIITRVPRARVFGGRVRR